MPYYLGNEVYAEYDGGILVLRVGSPDSPPVVYMVRDTLDALNRFVVRRFGEGLRRAFDDDVVSLGVKEGR